MGALNKALSDYEIVKHAGYSRERPENSMSTRNGMHEHYTDKANAQADGALARRAFIWLRGDRIGHGREGGAALPGWELASGDPPTDQLRRLDKLPAVP